MFGSGLILMLLLGNLGKSLYLTLLADVFV